MHRNPTFKPRRQAFYRQSTRRARRQLNEVHWAVRAARTAPPLVHYASLFDAQMLQRVSELPVEGNVLDRLRGDLCGFSGELVCVGNRNVEQFQKGREASGFLGWFVPGLGAAKAGKGLKVARGLDDAAKLATRPKLRPTKHYLDRKINRQIRSAEVLDAYKSPLRVGPVRYDKFGRPSRLFQGRRAQVVVNPQTGDVVSVYPTGSRLRRQLLRRAGVGE